MSVKLNVNKDAVAYTRGVVGRLVHHAAEVEAVFPALYGFILVYADPGSVTVRKGRIAEMGNMGWANFDNGARRIAFSYNHKSKKIEAHENSIQGEVIAFFDNDDSLTDILAFFKSLAGSQ